MLNFTDTLVYQTLLYDLMSYGRCAYTVKDTTEEFSIKALHPFEVAYEVRSGRQCFNTGVMV